MNDPAAPSAWGRALGSPIAQILAWAGVALSCYPWLWGKDGSPLFRLDAWIYHHAVAQWHAGGSLYDWYANPSQQLWPFTYPPFAAWALTPLTWVGDRGAQVLMVAATPVCTALVAAVTLRRLGARPGAARGAAPWIALAAISVVEPVGKTMEYGQVNALLMALVAVDLLGLPPSSRWRGVLSGLAAAFKLTPAIALLVLLARRQWRAAATMTATALGVTTVCTVLSPRESADFFLRAMWDPGRAGFADYSGNQNLKGLVARWLPEQAWTPVWAACVLAALAGTWVVLRRLEALRRARPEEDDVVEPLQLAAAMMLGLLVSPISWSHHWVWAVPALIALIWAGARWQDPGLLTAAAAGLAVFAMAMHWWFPEQNHVEQHWPWWAGALGSSYTWWALAAGAVLARSARTRGIRDDGARDDGARARSIRSRSARTGDRGSP